MPTYGQEVPLSAVFSNMSSQRGGKRNRQLRDKSMTSMALQGLKQSHPKLFGSEKPLSLSGDVTLEVSGADLLVPSAVAPTQTPASLVIWNDGAGNYTTLYAIGPGKLGNHIQITINTPDGGPVVTDSDEATTVPKVTITPQAGNYAATLTALNTSKLIRAVQTVGGGTMASLVATDLAGGKGEGIKLFVGSLEVYNCVVHGALFNGLDTSNYLKSFVATGLQMVIGNTKLAAELPGTPAAGAMVMLAVEYDEPMWRAEMPLYVGA